MQSRTHHLHSLVFLPIFLLLGGALLIPHSAQAKSGVPVEIKVTNEERELSSFFPFGQDYRGDLSFDSGDLGTDEIDEIIVGAGAGLSPSVTVFRQDGSLIGGFEAYHESFTKGIYVTACDTDQDGVDNIITGTREGGGPHVRIFSPYGDLIFDFFAYDIMFRGGVRIACDDVDGDGVVEIVTAPGTTGAPHLRIFNVDGTLMTELYAGYRDSVSGLHIATGDVDGDGAAEIITSTGAPADNHATIFDMREGHVRYLQTLPGILDYENGLQVTSADVDNDGVDEIGFITSNDNPGRIRFVELSGSEAAMITPFDSEEEKGVLYTTISNDASSYGLAASFTTRTSDEVGKSILVDISKQTLYAYENGLLVNEFLVSTGQYAFPTPIVESEISAKLLYHDYVWSYGPDNPNNYSLPGVKYNLRFLPHYYIHYAYWHNNFGNRMSHGCVNVNLENSEWIYDWAEVGTKMTTTQTTD